PSTTRVPPPSHPPVPIASSPHWIRAHRERTEPGSAWNRPPTARADSGDPATIMSAVALRTRVLILAAILTVAFAGLTSRLGWLMIVKRGELAALAERQYSRTVALHGARGPIVDRHGAPLATSTPAESLFAQPRPIGHPVRLAATLAPLLAPPA